MTEKIKKTKVPCIKECGKDKGKREKHTIECKKNRKRKLQLRFWMTERRKKLKTEHKCFWCMKEVEPIVFYPQYCEEHRKKIAENERKRK